MAYVYILRCRGNRLYTGYTEDLEHRMKVHFSQSPEAAKFTRAFPAEELLMAWELPDKSSALKLEAAVKKLPRRKKEELLLHPETVDRLGQERMVGCESFTARICI